MISSLLMVKFYRFSYFFGITASLNGTGKKGKTNLRIFNFLQLLFHFFGNSLLAAYDNKMLYLFIHQIFHYGKRKSFLSG